MKKLAIIFVVVALNIILVIPAFSDTKPQPSKPAAVLPKQVETPLCYLQTPDGKMWDLNSLCEQDAEKNNSSSSRIATINPYNNAAIKKFDDDLYGEDN